MICVIALTRKIMLNGSADMNIIMNETCVQSKIHKSPLLSLIIENSIMVIRTFFVASEVSLTTRQSLRFVYACVFSLK
ncbi:hypothetical protein QTP88_010666 [Uroleucon formosanum]